MRSPRVNILLKVDRSSVRVGERIQVVDQGSLGSSNDRSVGFAVRNSQNVLHACGRGGTHVEKNFFECPFTFPDHNDVSSVGEKFFGIERHFRTTKNYKAAPTFAKLNHLQGVQLRHQVHVNAHDRWRLFFDA